MPAFSSVTVVPALTTAFTDWLNSSVLCVSTRTRLNMSVFKCRAMIFENTNVFPEPVAAHMFTRLCSFRLRAVFCINSAWYGLSCITLIYTTYNLAQFSLYVPARVWRASAIRLRVACPLPPFLFGSIPPGRRKKLLRLDLAPRCIGCSLVFLVLLFRSYH